MSGDLPEGWVEASFEDVTNNHDGKRIPLKREDRAKRQGAYRYYGASGVIDTIDDYLFDGSFLLIGEDGANLLARSTPIAFEAEGQFWVNNHAHVVTTNGGIPLAYFRNYINSISLAPYVSGSAQPKLTQKALNSIELPLPPLNEQKRIVAKIDALTEKSREARQALDEVPALLDQLRQSILAAAFRGDLTKKWREQNQNVEPASALLDRIRKERRRKWEEAELAKFKSKGKLPPDDKWKSKYVEPEPVDTDGLPELPVGWCWASVEELNNPAAPICYGVVQPGEPSDDGVPLVRVCDLGGHAVRSSRLRTISREVDEQYVRSRLAGGEVLVSLVGTVGRVALVSEEFTGANIARAIARLTPVLNIEVWLSYWLASPYMQDRLVGDAREVARKTLNLDLVKSQPVPVAPSEEQAMVSKVISQARDALITLLLEAELHEESLSTLDASILAKAFRGELVPQDPNDEPASVLLERIRKERKDGAPKKSRGKRR